VPIASWFYEIFCANFWQQNRATVKSKPAKIGLHAHDSAVTHVSGRSEFIDDKAATSNEATVGLVLSPLAHAEFTVRNLAEVLALPGVLGVFTAADFSHNFWGTIFQDQPLLADSVVRYAGEALLIIAATSEQKLNEARAALRIDYKKLPAILSIDQARQAASFIGAERKIERGNVDQALKRAKFKVSGSIEIAGAEHFYLEPQCALALPQEDSALELWSSTQHPTEVQHVMAHGLAMDSKDVVVRVQRMGGGFGGKESQSAPIAAYAALVARRLNRPARIVLTREEDMAITGKRNPFKNFYEVGFDARGKIDALDLQLFSDAGAYADLSTSIMERAMLHSDSSYFIANMRVVGKVCRTNFHPHTAFRGFGAPKGVLVVERIIEEIAHKLGKDAYEIRKLNCYRGKNNVTHYGQRIENNCLPKLLDQLGKTSHYSRRRKEISLANKQALTHGESFIRGLSLTPVKFGISFTTRFLNQGNAMVNVYRDGSVQVSTGATEMGQGAYRRIAQVVAEELGIPLDCVRVMSTSTEKNANTSPTAASTGTDINGAAAALACQQIKGRLAHLAVALFKRHPKRWASITAGLGTEEEIRGPLRVPAQNIFSPAEFKGVKFKDGTVRVRGAKQISFGALCNEAYLNRVSLCEYAHYAIPGLGYNKVLGKGAGAFLYYTQGAACSEVSIDLQTGESKVLRSDILMDLGRPINKGLDIGQIQGAFVQGMGWLTLEKLFYSDEGKLLSVGPSTYKIPAIHDIPRDWKIELLNNGGNLKNLRGTKAVGEPPLLLAISIWSAIQNAVSHLPHCVNPAKYPGLNVPADSETVMRAIYPQEFTELETVL